MLPLSAQIGLVVTLSVAVIDWYAVWREDRRLEYVAKPATLVVLILVAVIIAAAPTAAVSRLQAGLFVAALVFSLAGDVLLMVRDDIIPGLVAFLVAHVFYIAGFNVLPLPALLPAVGVIAAVGVLALALCARVFGWFQGVKERPAVFAYICVIGLMVASAGTLPWREGVPAVSAASGIVGAVLFFASDSLIAFTRFVQPVEHGQFWIMTTYHLGQVGLVLSLLA